MAKAVEYVVRHKETKMFLCVDWDERLNREVDSYSPNAASHYPDKVSAIGDMDKYKIDASKFEIIPTGKKAK